MKKDQFYKLLFDGQVSESKWDTIFTEVDSVDKDDFNSFIKRVYDLNEDIELTNSEAVTGILHNFNRFEQWRKNLIFKRNIKKKGFRENKKLIIAEGDSWFEYPLFIRDILDWIYKDRNYSLYTLASGGDWIGNMIYKGDYITELSKYYPEVFLISGGGNDLVGDSRIATLIKKKTAIEPDDIVANEKAATEKNIIATKYPHYSDKMCDRIVEGRKYLSKDFYDLLSIFYLQYCLLFNNLKKSKKFDSMKIITQGYDFAIPSRNKNIFKNPLRLVFGNGKWLSEPLNMRGIYDDEEQRSVVAAMIFEFNEMLIYLGAKFDNIYHIDCRGLAKDNEWKDELHLSGKLYKKIAMTYKKCIDSEDTTTKVYQVSKPDM